MGRKNAVRIKQVGPKVPGGGGAGMMGPGGLPLQNPMEDLMNPPVEELAKLKLPDRPADRGYKVFWPLHQTFSMDTTNFRCVYPNYLDATKSVGKGGRRLPLRYAVPNPTASDLSGSLQVLSVRHVLQPYRGYSRDPDSLWDNLGRVLVDMTGYKNKLELLKAMAEKIPFLTARIERLKRHEQEQRELDAQRAEYLLQQQQASAAASSPSTAGAASASSSNKKNKKGGGKGRK